MKAKKTKPAAQNEVDSNLLALKPDKELAGAAASHSFVIGKGIICKTDSRPRKRSRLEIVVDATEGFVPLWAENLVLRWEFNTASFAAFQRADELKQKIRDLLNGALAGWGDAAPIRFTERTDNSDFQIVMKRSNECDPQGCVLAEGFFPDAGRHKLSIYPKMFEQTKTEQVETLEHEIGHIFGLRHFFAPDQETEWPSEIYGKHKPFSIMNYGEKSHLTAADKADLKKLYENAWNGTLTKINRTPIKLVRPFHYLHQ